MRSVSQSERFSVWPLFLAMAIYGLLAACHIVVLVRGEHSVAPLCAVLYGAAMLLLADETMQLLRARRARGERELSELGGTEPPASVATESQPT